MRNTPGNIIQFPESTLLVDVQHVAVNLTSEEPYFYYGDAEVALEKGYVYHLTNGGIMLSVPDGTSGSVNGSVVVEISKMVGTHLNRLSVVGDDFLLPPHTKWYGKSQTMDLWLWGDVFFAITLTLGVGSLDICRYDLFLVKYRR
jgi:hypothetical protein